MDAQVLQKVRELFSALPEHMQLQIAAHVESFPPELRLRMLLELRENSRFSKLLERQGLLDAERAPE